jgi:hypothetical protein
MAEKASKIIDSDKKISDKTIYSFSSDDINIKKAEMLIKTTPIMKIILNKILVFSLYPKIDFLFSFSSEISILSQS